MSIVKIQGNASGTGTLTISAPNTNTDRSITLPDGAGEILTDASTLSSSNLSGALPAIDGSALTGISGGSIAQVVTATTSSAVYDTSGSWTDTGLSATITPTSSSNSILVIISQNLGYDINSNENGVGFKLLRGSTELQNDPDNAIFSSASSSTQTRLFGYFSFMHKDSPATTSATTYKTQFHTRSSAYSGFAHAQGYGGQSTIILMELS